MAVTCQCLAVALDQYAQNKLQLLKMPHAVCRGNLDITAASSSYLAGSHIFSERSVQNTNTNINTKTVRKLRA